MIGIWLECHCKAQLLHLKKVNWGLLPHIPNFLPITYLCFIYVAIPFETNSQVFMLIFRHTACPQWKLQPWISKLAPNTSCTPLHAAASKSLTMRVTAGDDGSTSFTWYYTKKNMPTYFFASVRTESSVFRRVVLISTFWVNLAGKVFLFASPCTQASDLIGGAYYP